MSRRQRFAMTFAVLLVAAPLSAQGTPQAAASQDSISAAVTPAPVVERAAAGPTLTNAAVGVRTNTSSNAPAPMAPQGDVGRNPAMMIVGGAALIVGAIVGGTSGTIIMIGGGVLGLYGLWQYLK